MWTLREIVRPSFRDAQFLFETGNIVYDAVGMRGAYSQSASMGIGFTGGVEVDVIFNFVSGEISLFAAPGFGLALGTPGGAFSVQSVYLYGFRRNGLDNEAYRGGATSVGISASLGKGVTLEHFQGDGSPINGDAIGTVHAGLGGNIYFMGSYAVEFANYNKDGFALTVDQNKFPGSGPSIGKQRRDSQ